MVVSAGHEPVSHELESVALFPWDYISSCVGQAVCFLKRPINYPNFAVFQVSHLPTNPFFLQARLTGLFGPAPVPAPFQLPWPVYLPSLVPPLICKEWGGPFPYEHARFSYSGPIH